MHIERQLLTLTLFLALAAGSAWADETTVDTPNDSAPPSNIEGWVEDEDEEDLTNWTWFGMGYESRQTAAGATSSGGGASGAVSSIKKGGSRGRK